MGQPAFKLDPSLKSTSDEMRASWNSYNDRISKPLGKAVGGSGVSGKGFRQVKEEMQNISERMIQNFTNELANNAILDDALALATLGAINDAVNDNVEEALAGEAAAKALKNQVTNLDPNQAIDDFGDSMLPDTDALTDNDALQAAAMENAQVANDNVETPDGEAGFKQDALRPGALDREQERKNRAKEMQNHESLINQEKDPGKRQDLKEKYADYLEKEIKKMDERGKKQEAEADKKPDEENKPEEKKPTETPSEQNPENPEENPTGDPSKKVDDALDNQGLPLVDTDEDNPMLPKKTEAEKTQEAQQQGANNGQPNNENGQPEGQANESPEGQPADENKKRGYKLPKERGKITQGINYLRNRNDVKAKDSAIKLIQKQISKLNNEIRPIDLKNKLLNLTLYPLRATWLTLWLIVIVLYALAGILQVTIVLYMPIGVIVQAAASGVRAAVKVIGSKIDSIKKSIKENEDKIKDKKEKIKSYTNQIKRLAKERQALLNEQSLLGSGKSNAPANT